MLRLRGSEGASFIHRSQGSVTLQQQLLVQNFASPRHNTKYDFTKRFYKRLKSFFINIERKIRS